MLSESDIPRLELPHALAEALAILNIWGSENVTLVTNVKELSKKLEENRYAICHFIGHTVTANSLGVGESKEPVPLLNNTVLDLQTFSDIIKTSDIQHVILNSCNSGGICKELTRGDSGVSLAIGFATEVPDIVAKLFGIRLHYEIHRCMQEKCSDTVNTEHLKSSFATARANIFIQDVESGKKIKGVAIKIPKFKKIDPQDPRVIPKNERNSGKLISSPTQLAAGIPCLLEGRWDLDKISAEYINELSMQDDCDSRANELSEMLYHILEDSNVGCWGEPGIGKSTEIRRLIEHPAILTRFDKIVVIEIGKSIEIVKMFCPILVSGLLITLKVIVSSFNIPGINFV